MIAWVLRAIVLGALTVALRAVLGFGMIYWPTHGSWMRILALVVLIAAVVLWAVADGVVDRRAHQDPERDGGADLTMRWLKAAVVAGLGGGLAAWALDYVPKFDLGDNGLLFELTAGAAFIVLIIFVPATAGVAVGHFLAGRRRSERHPVSNRAAAV